MEVRAEGSRSLSFVIVHNIESNLNWILSSINNELNINENEDLYKKPYDIELYDTKYGTKFVVIQFKDNTLRNYMYAYLKQLVVYDFEEIELL